MKLGVFGSREKPPEFTPGWLLGEAMGLADKRGNPFCPFQTLTRGLVRGCRGNPKGRRSYASLRRRLLPFLRVFLYIVSPTGHGALSLSHAEDGSESRRPLGFLVVICLSFPVRFLSPTSSRSLVPVAAASPITFIRWRPSRGRSGPASSHKGEACVPFGVKGDLGIGTEMR
ncbi:hypothetical protein EYF80_004788 [Liparis tanakae]|uniref:Uncharacterized protein n=1 Tax=Liparis tanakae TaxID=230148 RepID=A0A4Z2J5F3_9TELE|nr:hypothetical protein EYF80_004788 [Liparis tanakae]